MNAKIVGKKVLFYDAVKIIGGENGADSIGFECPYSFGDVNLSTTPAYIKTCNAIGGQTKLPLLKKIIADGFEAVWNITAAHTAVSGELDCQISFETSNGNIVFNTEVFTLTVEKEVPSDNLGIDVASDPVTSLQNSLQTQLDQVNGIIAGGIVNSVNGTSGIVSVTPQSIGALKNGDNVSALTNDSGYITASAASLDNFYNKAQCQSLITDHNNSMNAHSVMYNIAHNASIKADQALNAALGKKTAYTVSCISELVSTLNAAAKTDYATGDCFYLMQSGVPDFWICGTYSQSVPFNYVSDADFIEKSSDLTTIGYYMLYPFESKMPDISGLVKNTVTVNGKALTQNIALTAADVSALPDSVIVPSALSDVTDDSATTPITRAKCDMYGNVISDAYVKKTDDVMCGATPLKVASGANVVLGANEYTVITLTEDCAITLGTGVTGFNNYWQAEITQPQTAVQVTLPAQAVWDNDCAPVMAAESTCVITFWFVGSVLHACFD